MFVICVEYGPDNAALKLILQYTFFGRFHWGLYLDKEFVGTLCNRPLTNELSVVSVNLSTKEEMFVRTVLPSFVSSYAYFGDYYESKWNYRIFIYSANKLFDPGRPSLTETFAPSSLTPLASHGSSQCRESISFEILPTLPRTPVFIHHASWTHRAHNEGTGGRMMRVRLTSFFFFYCVY